MNTSPAFVGAITYCLAYDHWRQSPNSETLGRLLGGELPRTDDERLLNQMIQLARLVAQESPDSTNAEEPQIHLQRIQEAAAALGNPKVALLMGGATKIKQYVFESARLPEIRGASGLLDRINLYELPALFAKQPSWLREFDAGQPDSPEKAEADQLVAQVRTWFQGRYNVEPPDCEECIIYASGGEVLAFAPLKLAVALTEAIEGLYTQQTLSANSTAVWRPCALAELRFGLCPWQFWLPEFSSLANETVRALVQGYYGGLDTESFLKRKTLARSLRLWRWSDCGRAMGMLYSKKRPSRLPASKLRRMPGAAAVVSTVMP